MRNELEIDLQGAPRGQLPGLGARSRTAPGSASRPRRASAAARLRQRSCAAASAHAGSHARVEPAPSCGVVTMSGGRSGSSMSARTPCGSSSRTAGGWCSHSARCFTSAPTIELHGSIPHEKLASRERARRLATPVRHARPARSTLEVLDHEPGTAGGERRRAARRLSSAAELPDAHPQRDRGGSARLHRARSPCAAPPAGRRVAVVDVGGGSAQVVVGTRRDGPDVAALDRPRLAAPDEPAARRRPAGRGGDRRRARRGRRAICTSSIRPSLAWRSRSAAAHARSSGSSGRGSDATSSRRRSSCSPTRPRWRSSQRFGIGADRVGTLAAGAVILDASCRRGSARR